MKTSLGRLGLGLIWPTALPIFATMAWLLSPLAPPAEHPVLSASVLVLFAMVLVMSWRMHRTAVFFCALAIGGSALGLRSAETGAEWLEPATAGTALILPIVLMMIVYAGERALFSASGLMRLGMILCGAALVAWLTLPEQSALLERLQGPLFYTPLMAYLRLGEVIAAVAVLTGMALGMRYIDRGGAVESALLGSLVAAELALFVPMESAGRSAWMAVALLILMLGLAEGFYSLAYRDELTGLPARRALNELLDELNGRYTLAMVDVDHFKKFNDRYGHDAGDQVLKMVAAHLASTGGGGRAFRYGGEEFTLVFQHMAPEDAFRFVDAIRQDIEQRKFVIRSWTRPRKKPMRSGGAQRRRKVTRVTVSIGIAGATRTDRNPSAVIKRADTLLYRAKREGRNRVIMG